jgi:hypothetical protein
MRIFQPIVSGSLTISGPIFFRGLTSNSQSNVVLIDTASGQLYITASSALGGGGGTIVNTGSFVTTSSFNNFTSSYTTGSFTGSFTGRLFGTASYSTQALSSSYALTASFALNGGGGSTNTGSLLTTASVNLNTITFTKGDGSTFPITVNTGSGGGGGGSSFPFTGSAGISGSLDLNGPLNSNTQSFNINNNNFIQNAIYNPSIINLNTVSNQVSTINRDWNQAPILFTVTSITSGSIFNVLQDESYGQLPPQIGTKVFISGSQTDGYGIPNYKFLGIVTTTGSTEIGETFYYFASVRAYITTSSLDDTPPSIRFYNTGSGLGIINLNGTTNISGSLIANSITGSLFGTASFALNTTPSFPFTGSARISGSLDLNGPLNSNTQNFNINNSTITQTGSKNAIINLNPYSLVPSTLNREWTFTESNVTSITEGSTFIFIKEYPTDTPQPNAPVGTLVFLSGSESDFYGIPEYKFLGIVSQSYNEIIGGEDPNSKYYAVCIAYTTTSWPDLYPNTIRFYNGVPSPGSGSINLNGDTTVNGDTTIGGNTTINGSTTVKGNTIISGSTTITGSTSIRGNTIISGSTTITGSTTVSGSTSIRGNTTISGSLTLTGSLIATSFTGSLLGTSSRAVTASYALNGGVTTIIGGADILITSGSGGNVTVSSTGGGGAFPFTGSARISGSIDLDGPLNSDIQNFNITNDTVIQNSVFNSSSINLTSYSNKPSIINQQWDGLYDIGSGSVSYSITSGSSFYVDAFAGSISFPQIGTKVFYSSGSQTQTDGYNIPNYKFLGIVTGTTTYYTGGDPDYLVNRVIATAYITTSSLDNDTSVRYYNTGSTINNGTINLNSTTNVNGVLNVSSSIISPLYLASGSEFRGPLTITNTASINNLLIIGNNNLDKKYLQFGKLVNNYAVDANFINLSRNAQSGVDVFNRLNTRLQFNQGFPYTYYDGEDPVSAIGSNTLSYLDFQTDTTYLNIIDLNFVAQGYSVDSNNNFTALPIKGFNTNYNGTTYFNVIGAVSASAYYGNGSNLTGIFTNPFTGNFIVNGTSSINGILTSSIANLDTINSTNGINGVFISEGSGSNTTNLVLGDPRALSTLNLAASAISGRNNIAIGSGSLVSATSTFRNIALGNNIMPLVTSNGSNNNIGIGFDVFTASTTSITNNIAIGNSASYATTTGDNNIAIGTEALFSNTSFGNNIAIGLRAGKLATGAGSSIFIGVDAGSNVTSGDNNIAIGFEALKFLTTVNNNIAIGYQAMVSGSGAQDSIAIGSSALRNITTGDDNLAIGANALSSITTAAGNLAIGTDSMISTSATATSNNTSIGFQSLQNITGSNNVVLGYRTMQGVRFGSNNTVIGYNNISGSGVSGSNNTIIGANVVLPDGVYNNRIIIADGQGTQRISVSGSITSISGSLSITGSGAIFTLQPQDPLPTVNILAGSFAVSSSIPPKPYFWDGSVWNALY